MYMFILRHVWTRNSLEKDYHGSRIDGRQVMASYKRITQEKLRRTILCRFLVIRR